MNSPERRGSFQVPVTVPPVRVEVSGGGPEAEAWLEQHLERRLVLNGLIRDYAVSKPDRHARRVADVKESRPDDRRDVVRRRGEDGEGRRGRQGGLRRHSHRAGPPGHVPEDPGRLLRCADPVATARVLPEPRGAHDHHQPVRQVLDARHREGDPAGRPPSTRATTARSSAA